MSEQHEPLSFPFPETGGIAVHPRYAALYDQPLVRVRMPYGDDAWLATRHADVRQVLADPRFGIVASRGQDQPRARPGARVGDGLFSMDPPDHTRVRSAAARHFTARRIAQLRDRVAEMAGGLVDAMAASGAPADFMAAYTIPLPTMVICDLLGMPPEDHERVWAWGNSIMSNTATAEQVAADFGAFMAYMRDGVEQRRRAPGDDLLTTLVQACDEEERITEREMLGLTADLLGAGFITTTSELTNFLYALLTHPDQLALLRERPGLVPGAVEELMRYVPALSATSLPRYANEDVEVGGVTVAAGDPVLVAISAANHDPYAYEDPSRLDIRREGAPHLTFGHGPHYCMGSHLARLEMQVTLELLVPRFPGLRLAVPDEELRWQRGRLITCPEELPIAW
ncbi:cytochrome P450 [Streptomyces avicenniae]|uniref:cytochrome P450 n=1 Tax=Streptomyces avicenniae TaxID=500153 RepID=UPI00069BAFA0|nr:cytochrome P450 [Streptomyces avicenniae]